MSENFVEVLGKDEETAVLLLEAAEKSGLEADVVRTTSDGFLVPKSLADKAKVKYEEPEDDELSFSTRAEAEQYAKDHDLTIEGAADLKADDYKAAVVTAAGKKG